MSDVLVMDLAREDAPLSAAEAKRIKRQSIPGLDWDLFSNRLSYVLEMSGLTTVDVERNTGMLRQYFSEWLKGTKRPGLLSYFYLICKTLQVNPAYLLGLSKNIYLDAASFSSPDPRATAEAQETAVIMDALPLTSRLKILELARAEQKTIDEWVAYVKKRDATVRDRLEDYLATAKNNNSASILDGLN